MEVILWQKVIIHSLYPNHLGYMYRKVSNIRRTKSQNLNASRLIL